MDQPAIREAVRSILTATGEDPDRPGMEATPDRVARMYEEVFGGVGRDPADELDVTFVEEYDELILLRDIPLYSFCEHHLLPFTGRAHVGYVPNDGGQITRLSNSPGWWMSHPVALRSRSVSPSRSPTPSRPGWNRKG